MRVAEVVVLGSLNMDLVVKTERMPRSGETVHGHEFATIPGGKGANQAAAVARLGGSVEMIGCVGDDSFGPTLLENLRAQGVGISHVKIVPDIATGIAMIMVDSSGENSIVVAPGANNQVRLEDLEATRSLLAQARYLVMQLEIPIDVVRAAISLAQGLGVATILNAAPAPPVEGDYLQGAHYVVVNEMEAQALTGIEVKDLSAAGRAGQALLAKNVGVAIVTLGAQGALWVTQEDTAHVPAREVKVVDTTAAGDAFVGGLTVALLNQFDLGEAVRYATCAGTLATTVLGAQPSLPSQRAVKAFYEGGH
ncbi:MAG: ribokinase [Chloroflexi bacterium RBG_13_56_8]|nr:MAG: ribokinase [Chloroflexi bacterium RBG_13_56_8]